MADVLDGIRADVAAFVEEEGRRPRVLVVEMGRDGHGRSAEETAVAFADIGFDVDVGPRLRTPAEAARQAIENDVHLLDVSSGAAGCETLAPRLIEELKRQGGENIVVVSGGDISQAAARVLKIPRGKGGRAAG